jgi:transposase
VDSSGFSQGFSSGFTSGFMAICVSLACGCECVCACTAVCVYKVEVGGGETWLRGGDREICVEGVMSIDTERGCVGEVRGRKGSRRMEGWVVGWAGVRG